MIDISQYLSSIHSSLYWILAFFIFFMEFVVSKNAIREKNS